MLSTTIVFRRLSARPAVPSYRLLLRTIHGSPVVAQRQRDPPNPVSHGVENYFVDSDDTLPPDASIYKVDATSDAAESAYEPPSGPWSRAGAETDEYQAASKEPYEVPKGTDAKLRHGGKKRYTEDRAPETSKTGEGPQGTERWGRKPEGRA
ncbi:hypothetical protein OG21DRAFT_855706 [Imleria badia]|nr:hypothetical protein OG21DRAFT_855706 [Imleria badia]